MAFFKGVILGMWTTLQYMSMAAPTELSGLKNNGMRK